MAKTRRNKPQNPLVAAAQRVHPLLGVVVGVGVQLHDAGLIGGKKRRVTGARRVKGGAVRGGKVDPGQLRRGKPNILLTLLMPQIGFLEWAARNLAANEGESEKAARRRKEAHGRRWREDDDVAAEREREYDQQRLEDFLYGDKH